MNDRVMDKGLTHKMLLNMLVEWSGQSSETFCWPVFMNHLQKLILYRVDQMPKTQKCILKEWKIMNAELVKIELKVNGKKACKYVAPSMRLAAFLREALHLIGTQKG